MQCYCLGNIYIIIGKDINITSVIFNLHKYCGTLAKWQPACEVAVLSEPKYFLS